MRKLMVNCTDLPENPAFIINIDVIYLGKGDPGPGVCGAKRNGAIKIVHGRTY